MTGRDADTGSSRQEGCGREAHNNHGNTPFQQLAGRRHDLAWVEEHDGLHSTQTMIQVWLQQLHQGLAAAQTFGKAQINIKRSEGNTVLPAEELSGHLGSHFIDTTCSVAAYDKNAVCMLWQRHQASHPDSFACWMLLKSKMPSTACTELPRHCAYFVQVL